jgi:hypothetical protein
MEVRQDVTIFMKIVDNVSKTAKNLSKNLEKPLKNAERSFKNFGIRTSNTMNEIKNKLGSFRMEFLSIMFGGMVIMRTFQGIMRTSTEMFMKITEGATPAGQAVTALNAEMAYLKFTIGRVLAEALLPLLPTLISLITWFRNFVKDNPSLVASFIFIAFALGLIMYVIGTLILLANGLAMAFGGTASIMFVAILKVLGIMILLGIFIFALNEMVKAWGIDWSKTTKYMIIALLALGTVILIIFGWFPALIAVIMGLFVYCIAVIVSNWEQLKLNVKIIMARLWNWLLTTFEKGINKIIDMFRPLLEVIGISVKKFSLEKYKNDFKELNKEWQELEAKKAQMEGNKGLFGGLSAGFSSLKEQFFPAEQTLGTNTQTVPTQTTYSFGDLIVNYSGESGSAGDNIAQDILDGIKRRT